MTLIPPRGAPNPDRLRRPPGVVLRRIAVDGVIYTGLGTENGPADADTLTGAAWSCGVRGCGRRRGLLPTCPCGRSA